MIRIALLLAMFGSVAQADTLFAQRTLRPGTLILASDLIAKEVEIAGMARAAEEVVGMEARTAIYAGRPIALSSIGPPALVERNQIVVLQYARGGLSIAVEGRAMGRGGAGDRIRVMNSASRSTVTGVVAPDGTVHVF